MKRCPECMNVTASSFCPECGHDMSTVEALICPKCGSETTSRFCPNCGTKMLENSEQAITKDSDETLNKEIDITPAADINDSTLVSGNSSSAFDYKTENSDPQKKLRETVAKKPIIAGAIIAAIVLVLLASIGGSNKKIGSTSTDANTDTYSTFDENSQGYDSANDSTYSGSSSYSDTGDGLNYIQGTWDLIGVVTDGESTNVAGLSLGSLEINGDRWTMIISTNETTENSGTLYLDLSGYLDSGEPYYVYTMRSDGMSGSVKMTYSAADNFIAVSTNSTLDSNNCMMFGR